MIRAAVAALALALVPSVDASADQDWALSIDSEGLRSVSAVGSARFGAQSSVTRLTLSCAPGVDGRVAWSLAVDATAVLGFDFAPFEGAQTPAHAERLSELSLDGGLLRPRLRTSTSGSFDGAGRFVLEFSSPALAASDAALLADSIGTQTTVLHWTVNDARDPALKLVAEIPLLGAAVAVRETMMGCGPAPPLDEAQRVAWQGRNPLDVGLFAQRAVQWRLKGLLGRDYDNVLQRLRSAQTVDRVGETMFVIAPDSGADDRGAVLMFVGVDTELVLIDDGQVTRYASRKGKIAIPDAVRSFVGALTVAHAERDPKH